MPYLIRITAFLCVSLLLILPVPAHSETPELPLVKIGLIFPLSGPMSAFGEDISRALPLLEKKFNSEQNKYKFALFLEDGKFGQSNAAITAAKKLVAVEGVRFLVIGSSGEVLQIAPYAEKAKILSVAGFASHPNIKSAGDYTFRTYIDAERGLPLITRDLKNKDLSRVAVITEEVSFTSAVESALRQQLGEKLVFSEKYLPGEADFKTLIAKARSLQPDAYYLNTATPASFIALFKQLRDNGLSAPVYTYYVPGLKEVQASLGAQLHGTLYLDFPGSFETSKDFQDFLRTFEQENGQLVSTPFNFKTNYNAIKVIIDSIMAVGPDASAAKDYLYKYDRPSATGRLRFDKNGDVIDLNLQLKEF